MPLRPAASDPDRRTAFGGFSSDRPELIDLAPEATKGVDLAKSVDLQPSPGGSRAGDAARRIALRLRRTGQTAWRGIRRLLPFTVGAAAMLAALLVYNQVAPPPAPLSRRDVNDAIQSALASQTPAPALSVDAYRAIAPSVVLVQVQVPPDRAGSDGQGKLGTGVVVSEQGQILTSLHVVSDATSIQLTFADGSKGQGQILDEQPEHDIAVLGASLPPGTPAAVLGNPNAVRIGDEAFVVGSPFGLYSSLSSGVISALDREFQVPSGVTLTGLIQIDAAVNPGNSGGPLVNRRGEVVGIVAALINPTREDVFVGIGLAVPIDVAGGGAGLPPY